MKGSRGFPKPNKDQGFRGFPERGLKRGNLGFPSIRTIADDTTADGKQAFLIIGDSTAQGLQEDSYPSGTYVPTVDATGHGYEYNITLKPIGPLGVETSFQYPIGGSCWEQFCITYHDITGYSPVIINCGRAGSQFYAETPSGGTGSWYTNYSLYADAVAKANEAISYLRVIKLKGIIVMCGINDITHPEATGDITLAMTSLVQRLGSDFPGINIYFAIPGISNQTPTIKYGQIRNFFFDLKDIFDNVHVAVNTNQMYSWDFSLASQPHFLQVGQNQIGKMFATYIANIRNDTDKDVRRVVNQFYDELSNSALDVIANGILAQKTAGNWQLVDSLQIYVAESQFNALVDWMGRTSALSPTVVNSTPGFGFVQHGYVSFDGVSQYMRTMMGSLFWKNASQNNLIIGVKTGVNSTAAGTASNLFGNSAGLGQSIGQDASSRTVFRLNNTTNQNYTTDTKIQDNTRYAVIRSGASVGPNLAKNGTVVSTKAIASGSPSIVFHHLGVLNSANFDMPQVSGYMNVQVKYAFHSANDGFDLVSFEAFLETIMSVL